MLKSEIYEEVGELLGELSGQEDFWSEAMRKRHIQRAVTRFCYEERWTWLLSIQQNVPLLAGNSEVELIDDIDLNRHFVLSVRPDSALDDGRTCLPIRVQPDVGMQLRIANTGRGAPAWYYVSHVQDNTYAEADNPSATALVAHVIPTPVEDSTVEYAFFRNPVLPTWDDDDEFPVPEQYIDAVVARAAGTLWLKELNGGGKAQEQFNIYQDILNAARREHKGLANDEILAWGAEEPQYGPTALDELYRRHLPASLG